MSYPNSIDAPTTTHSDLTSEVIHASDINALATSVIAIETELGTLPKGGSADVKTRIAATETVANAAIPKSTVTTAGDLIYASGNAAVTRLGIGAATDVLVGGASAPAWAKPPGYEFAYNQITAGVNITDTSESTATALITASSVTGDGATIMLLEFFSPLVVLPVGAGGTATLTFSIFEGTTQIARIAQFVNPGATAAEQLAVCCRYRFTPSAAAHTYKLCAFVSTTTGTPSLQAGSGGTNGYAPAYLRITKAA